MPWAVLTRGNIAALKRALVEAFPEIASGHADEAIAAGIGFRTHAALLAALKVHGPAARVVVWVLEARIVQRLTELQYQILDEHRLRVALGAAELTFVEELPWGNFQRLARGVANQN